MTKVVASISDGKVDLTISNTSLVVRVNTCGSNSGMTYPAAGIPISTGIAWGASIVDNSANWNTAFSWGDHAGLYDPIGAAAGAIIAHNIAFDHSLLHAAATAGVKISILGQQITNTDLGTDAVAAHNLAFSHALIATAWQQGGNALTATKYLGSTNANLVQLGANNQVQLEFRQSLECLSICK
jgi:hypothetical protein